jgi:hypothetical protein
MVIPRRTSPPLSPGPAALPGSTKSKPAPTSPPGPTPPLASSSQTPAPPPLAASHTPSPKSSTSAFRACLHSPPESENLLHPGPGHGISPSPMPLPFRKIIALILTTSCALSLSSCGLFNTALNAAMRAWPLLIENDSRTNPVPVRTGPVLPPAPVSPLQPQQPGMAAR